METPIPDSLRGGGTEGPPRVPASQQPPPVAPPTQAGEIGGGPTPDATGGVIPYKNPAALIGYYVGIFSLIPGLGVPLALAALVLGVVGLRMPIAFLLFAVTISERVMIAITFQLQLIASQGGYLLLTIFGYPFGIESMVEGNVISVIDDQGNVNKLNVAEACSGMRMPRLRAVEPRWGLRLPRALILCACSVSTSWCLPSREWLVACLGRERTSRSPSSCPLGAPLLSTSAIRPRRGRTRIS